MTLNAVVDIPTLTAADTSGDEDTAIPLTISAGLVDTDGSEILSITIAGVPQGTGLSSGTDNGDGSWTLTPAQLVGLTLTPPTHNDANFVLTVTATATEAANGDTVSTVDSINVMLNAVADVPTLTVQDTGGDEDAAIPLNISAALVDADGSESLSITIAGVPQGATLSAGIDNGGGSWTLTAAQLAGLTLMPPVHSDTDFILTVTASATEAANGDTASTVDSINVTLNAVVDIPTLTAADTSGDEDAAIPLTISAGLVDTDGSEILSITIAGVLQGAIPSAGIDNGDGSWTLTPAQLAGLTLTPPVHSDTDFTLTVAASATEAANGDTVSTVDSINVTVNAVVDTPTLTAADTLGDEDTAIPLTIGTVLVDTDGSESLSVIIADVPQDASLSSGTDNGDGSWTLTPAQLVGLTLTPPTHNDVNFVLAVTATATEAANGDTASTVDSINVTVNAVADAPMLTVQDTGGDEDTAIPLTISAGLVDTDGSEILSITIAGVPQGTSLSSGADNGDGSWTLTAAQLVGLTLTPTTHSDTDFILTVTATATEAANGDAASTVDSINVTVNAIADAPTLTIQDTGGDEDTTIPLNISAALVDADGSEILSVTIAGVPQDASLSSGADNGDGSWTLTPAQLAGLTLTPPVHSDADFILTVTATATEAANGDSASTVDSINVILNAVADTPTLTVQDTGGDEDTAIPLNISAALVDADGSESLSITIAGVLQGGALSAGTNNGDGSWMLTTAQLAGLTLTPPAHSDTDFTLTVTAATTEATNGDTVSTVDSINVTLNAVVDIPTLTAADTSGDEDTAIPLTISAGLVDTDGSEILSITIAGVPQGTGLSAGTDNGDGSWTLTPAQLVGLTLTPPTHNDANFVLTVTATTTEAANGDTVSMVDSINVILNAVADAPTLTVQDTGGDEDTAIPLTIGTVLVDTDGSESLSVIIADVPQDASLSSGADNGDGSWTLTPAQLVGLTLTPPTHNDANFVLAVTATATEAANGDSASTVDSINVILNAVADTPTLTVQDTGGDEDTAIPLTIGTVLVDTDGSESISIIIAGVSQGATLSAGINSGDGSWTLMPAQLTGLTLILPTHSNNDFSLTVSAKATESVNGDASETVKTLAVTVDPINDVPTVITPIADVTVDEDVQDTIIDLTGTFADVDIATNGDALTLSMTNNNPALMTATLAGTSLILDYLGNQHGTATLAVTATDLAGGFVSDAFTVTVNPVNDAPTVATLIADVTVDEDAQNTVIDLSSVFADVDIATNGDALTLSVENSNPALLTATLAGTSLTLDYLGNQHGTATLTVTATDLAGGFVSDGFTVTVNPVNDAPTVVNPIADVTRDEDAQNTVIDLSSGFADVDIAANGDALTLSVTNNNPALVTATLAGTSLTLDYLGNQHGPATLAVTATDLAGGFVSNGFTVTVNPVNDAPTVATPIADVTVDEDAQNTVIDLSSVFGDVDIATNGDALTLSVTNNNPALVTATLAGTSLTLDYLGNQHGTATLAVTATDLAEGFVGDGFTVTVNPVNDLPSANNDFFNVNEDGTLTENVLTNDSDIDVGDVLTTSLVNGVSNGTLNLNSSGLFSYAPNVNFNGTDSLTYSISDGNGGADTAAVTITINPVNDPPVAVDDTANVDPDTSVTIDVLTNDSDIDGDLLTVDAVTQGTNGSVINNGDGTVRYTPNPGFAADTDSFTYTVIDGNGGIDTAIVTVGVNAPTNVPPVVEAGVDGTADEGSTVSLGPAAFTDAAGDTHTAAIDWGDGTPPESGAVDGTAHTVSGSHLYLDNGVYTVTVTVTDNHGGVGSDTFQVTVNNVPPTITDVSGDTSGNEGASLTFSAVATDPAGANDPLTYTWDFSDGSGVSIGQSVSYIYADDGTYTVTVTVRDDEGGVSSQTTTVTVSNVAPTIANLSGDTSGDEGASLTFSVDATDPAGANDPLTYTWDFDDGSGTGAGQSVSHIYGDDGTYIVTVTVSDDEGGTTSQPTTVTVSNAVPTNTSLSGDTSGDEGGNFNFSADATDPAGANDPLAYTWNFGDGSEAGAGQSVNHVYAENGTFTATVIVSDDDGGETSQTATVTVSNVPPTVDAGPDATINEGDTFSRTGSFTDPGADTWTATVDYGDGSGTQPLTLNADKTFSLSNVYESDGTYTATVTVVDDNGSAGSDTVAAAVNEVDNNPPVVNDDTATTAEDTAVAINVLNDDTDPDNDVLTVSGVTQGDNGAVVNNNDGTVTYTPEQDFNGTDSFTYTVDDGNGGIATANATATVTPVNDLPTISGRDQSLDTNVNIPLSITLTGAPGPPNESSQALRFEIISGPDHGSLSSTSGDFPVTVTYTPDSDFSGEDSFEVEVADDEDGSTSATVEIIVLENQPPTANAGNDQGAINVGETVELDGSGSSDLEDSERGIPLTFNWTGDEISLSGPNPTFTAPFGAPTLALTLTVTDSGGLTATDDVTITINQPPVANAGDDQSVQPGDTVQLDSSGSSDLEDDFDELTFTWIGDDLSLSGLNPTFVFPQGVASITLTLTVEDSAGLTASDEVTIRQLFTANAGADRTVECISHEGATVAPDGSNSTAPDGTSFRWLENDVEIATGITPTVSLSLGPHTITIEVSDGVNTASDTVEIAVADTNPPTITAEDVTVECTNAEGETVDLPSLVTVEDICDESPQVSFDPDLSTFPLGETIVVVKAADASGNEAQTTFTVTVEDTQPPTITAETITVECASPEGTLVDLATLQGSVTVEDLCDENPTVSFTPPPDSVLGLGQTTVRITAMDKAGNEVTAQFTVEVVDTTPPTLSKTEHEFETDDLAGVPKSDVEATLRATAQDICDPSPQIRLINAPDVFQAGTTTLTVIAEDQSGNGKNFTVKVTVQLLARLPSFKPENQTQYIINTFDSFGFTLLVDNPDNFDFRVEANGVPEEFGARFNGLVFEWTPPAGAAGETGSPTYTIILTLIVDEQAVGAPLSVAITVNRVNRGPKIDPIPNGTVDLTGTTEPPFKEIQISASDPDPEAQLTFSVIRLGSSASLPTIGPVTLESTEDGGTRAAATLTWTPDPEIDAGRVVSFIVTVSDGEFQDITNFVCGVGDVNTPPHTHQVKVKNPTITQVAAIN